MFDPDRIEWLKDSNGADLVSGINYARLLVLFREQEAELRILRECETHRKELILERNCDDGGTR